MVGTVYKTAGAALALALGAATLAIPASAQERGDRGGWGEQRGGGSGGDRGGDRGGNWGNRGDGPRAEQPAPGRPAWNGSGRPDWNRPAPQPAPPPPPQAAPPQAPPQATGPSYRSYSGPGAGENRAPPQQGWDGRRWNGQNWNNGARDRDRDWNRDRDRDGRADAPRPDWQRDRGRVPNQSWDRNRSWDSNRGWDRNRGDPRRNSWSVGRSDGRWDRDWRRYNRYNWQGWRDSHREVYRIGRYTPPYRSYAYRRVGIGVLLDGGYFGSRYWISDPWMYRLPPAYGPYRWVRYYDDALLVDTFSGEVVDVIYDFFW